MKSKRTLKYGERLDITGERYGALVALYPTNNKKSGAYCWMFKCDCGNTKELPMNQVRYGSIKSCGCLINKKPHPKPKQRLSVGDKFGKLTVIELLGNKGKGTHFYSKVRCDCGNEFKERDSCLINGRVTQCRTCTMKANGQITHGLTSTRLFDIWQSMRGRCYNPNDAAYHSYGGRGISICPEWKDDFKNFYEWALDNGYSEHLTIDRIEVNGNYEPSNCRWATQLEQARNRRNTIYLNYEGKKLTIGEIADITGIPFECIYQRLTKYHWDEYSATHVPIKEQKSYMSKIFRKTVLTEVDTGKQLVFKSASQASLFVGRAAGYFSQKSSKLGNHFHYGKYVVDIDVGNKDEE